MENIFHSDHGSLCRGNPHEKETLKTGALRFHSLKFMDIKISYGKSLVSYENPSLHFKAPNRILTYFLCFNRNKHNIHLIFFFIPYFQNFLAANSQCWWNTPLTAATRSLKYAGHVAPGMLLVTAEPCALEILRGAYARSVLKPPATYVISSVGKFYFRLRLWWSLMTPNLDFDEYPTLSYSLKNATNFSASNSHHII